MATKKKKAYCVVKSDKPLNFRKGPSLAAAVYTTVNDGDKLEIVEPLCGDTTGFIKVKVNDTVGYVMEKYVILPETEPTGEEKIDTIEVVSPISVIKEEETNDGE